MNTANMHIAQLDERALQQLQSLEQQLGSNLVALEPDPLYATLSAHQLHELQVAEKALGKILIAYRDH